MTRIKSLALALLLTCPLFAQQDVRKTATTPFLSILSVPWGPGTGNLNNTFWFNSLSPVNAICISVYNNNPTNAHPFTLAVSQTNDPTTQGFVGFAKQWSSVVGPVTFPQTIAVNTSASYFYSTRSAAFIALTFTGSTALGGVPDTANIIIVQGNFDSCASSTSLNNTGAAVSCNRSATITLASGAHGSFVDYAGASMVPPAGQRIHVCAYSVSGSASASALSTFQDGSGGICTGALGSTDWAVTIATGNSSNQLGSGIGQIFQTNTAGQPLCANNGATGAADTFTIAYNIF